MMMDLFFYPLLSYFVLSAFYLLLLTAAACLFRKRVNDDAPRLKIAVVIPAHNESTEIAHAIAGIKLCDYPENKVQIFVIADNCSDDTAQRARKAGATVFERDAINQRGKGAALHWFLSQQKEAYADFDAVTIIDADTVPASQYLKEISASLSAPDVQAVQGYYGVANPNDNWMTALSLAALSIVHHLRPAGRECIGGSAGLKGNGMAFRSSLVRNFGWPCNSIVEDLEYTNFLLSKGIKVHYNPDAVVYGEMPTNRSQAEPQRRRWEEGRFRLAFGEIPGLLSQLFGSRRFAFLDAVIELLILPLSLLMALDAVLLGWAALHYPGTLPLLLSGTAAIVVYVIVGMALRRPPRYVWLALMAAPAFILFKLSLYAKMLLFKPTRKWVRTTRNSELSEH